MRITLVLMLLLLTTASKSHPLKMAYTSVKYIPERQVFEISHRVFQDDFELTLQTLYGYTGGDVYLNQKKRDTQAAVNTFFLKNFVISFNGKLPKLRYIKTEQQHQMGIIVTYETEKVALKDLRTIAVLNRIMMESFREQVNMFHLSLPDQPARTLKFELGKEKEVMLFP